MCNVKHGPLRRARSLRPSTVESALADAPLQGLCVRCGVIVPQRQEPSSCCTSSSLVWQRWQRLRLRCLQPPRDEEDDEAEDGEDSSASGASASLARFSGETSLSESEAAGTWKHRDIITQRHQTVKFSVAVNCKSLLSNHEKY